MPKTPYRRTKKKTGSNRVRNVLRIAPHRVVGQFAWVKHARTSVYWESRLERDAIRILAVDPQVSAVQDQPFTVNYRFDGTLHQYTPDFKIIRLGVPSILEVKEFDEASEPENQARFAEIARVLANEDLTFTVWTEKEFRQKPRLSNATYILRYRNYPYDRSLGQKTQRLLEKHCHLRASELRRRVGANVTIESIFAQVCHGLIYLDCDQPRSLDPVFHRVPI